MTARIGIIVGFTLLASACATDPNDVSVSDAGRTPLGLSASTADAVEGYLRHPKRGAFAVRLDGGHWYWTPCTTPGCAADGYARVRASALENCEQPGRPCGILAAGDEVMWGAPVSLPDAEKNAVLLHLIEFTRGNEERTHTGRAEPVQGSNDLKLNIVFKNTLCDGTASPARGNWSLTCYSDPETKFAGGLVPGPRGSFIGRPYAPSIEVRILRRDWSTLETALKRKGRSEAARAAAQRRAAWSETYPVALPVTANWETLWGDFEGKVYLREDRTSGLMTLSSRTGVWTCTGSVTQDWSGDMAWNVSCGGTRGAKGTMTIVDDQILGDGTSNDGKKLTLGNL